MSSSWSSIIESELGSPPPIVVEVWPHQVNGCTWSLNLESIVDMDWHSEPGEDVVTRRMGALLTFPFAFDSVHNFVTPEKGNKRK